MTVYKQKGTGIWFYDFFRHGTRYKARCVNLDGTQAVGKRAAKACEAVRRGEIEKGERKPSTIAGQYTLAQAIDARSKVAKKCKHWRDVRIALDEIGSFFGPEADIEEVARRWEEYLDYSCSQTVPVWVGGPRKLEPDGFASDDHWRDTGRLRSPSRTNRYLDQLSAVLRKAHASKGADGRPHLSTMPVIKHLKEAKRDPRPVPLQLALRIEVDPRVPQHLRDAAALVRLFGFRLNEVFSATRDEIDFESRCYRLPAEKSKANRDEIMPANKEAVALLRRLDEQAEKREPNNPAAPLIVFQPRGKNSKGQPFKPRPISNPRRAWATALKRLGVKAKYRFHDLRGTFVTQTAIVAKSAVVQALARHTDPRTTARYIKVTDEEMRRAVERMARRR